MFWALKYICMLQTIGNLLSKQEEFWTVYKTGSLITMLMDAVVHFQITFVSEKAYLHDNQRVTPIVTIV